MAVDADTVGELTPLTETDPRRPDDFGERDDDRPPSRCEVSSGQIGDTEAEADSEAQAAAARPPRTPMAPQRLALIVGLVMIVALMGLAGWLGSRAHQSQQVAAQREVLLQTARQGALNLTTISYIEVDADIKRILDSSTGLFHDDFQTRSGPFVNVVKQAQSTSVGTITESGLESMQGGTAQVLVAVSVKTSTAGAAEQQPRAWRMRIDVAQVGDTAKVSNVEFVP
jgi:Mce-associated membrane protein